ncbi:hypothetical protein AXF42_Ash004111 [Apostasia shenzhenica]|uniref:Uncharacterized protein n=1 Tax=Apostasia shenzhenica TaxID=1088818 RepID=A0A2I0A1Y8_9ASPA|nr:hypothetical protein AXF42_Ash004111 [Apostasia shenzhenica]
MRSARKASEVVALLNLNPHPDGGFYSETLRDSYVIISTSQLPPRCHCQTGPKSDAKWSKATLRDIHCKGTLCDPLPAMKFGGEVWR